MEQMFAIAATENDAKIREALNFLPYFGTIHECNSSRRDGHMGLALIFVLDPDTDSISCWDEQLHLKIYGN